MKFDWQESELNNAVSLVIDYRGKTPKKLGGDWAKEGYRALSAKNIKTGRIVQPDNIRYVSKQMYAKWMKDEIRKGDIIITSEAPFGEVLYWNSDEKIVLSQRLFAVRIKKDYDSSFLYYYMTSDTFQVELRARATGTTVIGLRQPELLKCKIRYPKLDEQKRIASILLSIDEKINLNREINNNLQQQAFVLFDELFPNFADGEKLIGEYILPKRGKNLLSKDAIHGDVPVVAGGLEAATYHNAANTVAPVLTISASGANAGFVNLWHKPVWSSDSSYIDYGMTRNVYFWYVLLKKRQREIFDSQTGSAQPHIYPQHISAMRIPSVDFVAVERYVEHVKPLFFLIGTNSVENERLATLRDTLLPKLMSGEIDVSEVEI